MGKRGLTGWLDSIISSHVCARVHFFLFLILLICFQIVLSKYRVVQKVTYSICGHKMK